MKYFFKDHGVNDKYYLTDHTILKELNQKLNQTKSLIDDYPKEWETVKKQIHEHEYVYTSSYNSNNISKISPISRSYFKFREIYEEYNLLDRSKENKIVCLAEAPGGFIQSILHIVSENKIKSLSGITLLSEDKSVPKWNYSLKNNPRITFHVGQSGDGNLYDFVNVISLIKEIGRHSVDLVTGDGGFDYSSDYSSQEKNSLKLIYSEIFVALNIQANRGSFVCKIFDTFEKETIMLLSILNESYEEVSIYKPKISRFSNSEKYIVCLKYKGYNKEILSLLCHFFHDNQIDIPLSPQFINDIIHFNQSYCEKQMDHIQKGIQLIQGNQYKNKPTSKQIKSGKEWCIKYNIPINEKCNYLKLNNRRFEFQ